MPSLRRRRLRNVATAGVILIVAGASQAHGQPPVAGYVKTVSGAASVIRAGQGQPLLLAAGLTGSQVDVASHGETDLLVATADNVAEPRNRRVEVTVR